MNHPFDAIRSLLERNNIEYELIEHTPVFTSEQAAAIRGMSKSQGAKSLLIKAQEAFYLMIIPGDRKLDGKKVKTLLGAKEIRFATPQEVVQVMHCEVGACYPFGNIIHVTMYVDVTLSKNNVISFNPGVHDKSIKMMWKDYQSIIQPQMVEITKEIYTPLK
ncbi:MAG: hypothetical protein HY430_03385 [Candidatus Levybacteria bacterium]|nr:hypothetical protein [Candidatus Levybacteria bacterium]